MEVFFLATGVYHELDFFEQQLRFEKFLMPYYDPRDKKNKKDIVHGMLSPIKLYRYVFPKEYKDEVIAMLGLDDTHYQKQKKQAFVLRKALGLKKIPKAKEGTRKRALKNCHVNLLPIGFKEDVDNITDLDGTIHEAL